MRKSRAIGRLAALGLFVAALSVFGCSDSTKPKVAPPRYPETVDKETVVHNLLLSYEDCNIEQFVKLLHEDYVWYNQAMDVISGGMPESYTRAQEIEMTGNMFLARRGQHPDIQLDKLELEILDSPWSEIAEFEENPCSDCWVTTREYYLTLIMDGGAMTLIASEFVSLTIVPVSVNGTKVYRIIRADDLSK